MESALPTSIVHTDYCVKRNRLFFQHREKKNKYMHGTLCWTKRSDMSLVSSQPHFTSIGMLHNEEAVDSLAAGTIFLDDMLAASMSPAGFPLASSVTLFGRNQMKSPTETAAISTPPIRRPMPIHIMEYIWPDDRSPSYSTQPLGSANWASRAVGKRERL